MKYGFSGLALFVVGVVMLAFAHTAAIMARYVLFYAVRLNANAQAVPWMAYAPTMPAVISFVLLVAALYVMLAKSFSAQDQHWAYGTVGLLVGYWLK